MRSRIRQFAIPIAALAAALGSLMHGPDALGVDLHRLWDGRCAECHGHSGFFARKYLRVQDGTLVGRHPVRDVRLFLDNHYPPAGQVQAIYDMLAAQAATPPRFQDECSQCHGPASAFVRESLTRRGTALYGQKSGKALAEFLASHRGLAAGDAAYFTILLERVASETGIPAE